MLIKKGGLLDAIFSYFERRRLRRSFEAPFFSGAGRDLYRYYENGRSIDIYAELMLGPNEVRIHRQNLKWNDDDHALSATRQSEVLSKFCNYLDQQKVRWEYYGWEVNK
jgi:hypothetical protein